jgi:hypothetical protein
MKSYLFLFLFSIIICSPFGLERKQKLLQRIEKIKDCINENGTESLKNLIKEKDYITINYLLNNNIKI